MTYPTPRPQRLIGPSVRRRPPDAAESPPVIQGPYTDTPSTSHAGPSAKMLRSDRDRSPLPVRGGRVREGGVRGGTGEGTQRLPSPCTVLFRCRGRGEGTEERGPSLGGGTRIKGPLGSALPSL